MRRAILLFTLLAGLVVPSACGQYSFLVITLAPDSAVSYAGRQRVKTCTVSLSGAVNDSFNLGDCSTLSGRFEYATQTGSGVVSVKVDGIDISGNLVVTGSASDVKLIDGGSATATVTVACVEANCGV